jgi:small subunit ribosomal protein S3
MGQKVNPVAFRIGVNKETESVWYSKKNYAQFILKDKSIRDYIHKEASRAGISEVKIKRKTTSIEVTIKAARPGIMIGKGGEEAEKLKVNLQKLLGSKDVQLYVVEEKNVDMSAPILGESIARQLEKRIAFRRAMKQVVTRAMRAGVKGIKVMCAGRLGGAEIARTEWYREGRVPLQTIRADIDYAFTEAMTIYGKIGVKVWVYKGDILPQARQNEEQN